MLAVAVVQPGLAVGLGLELQLEVVLPRLAGGPLASAPCATAGYSGSQSSMWRWTHWMQRRGRWAWRRRCRCQWPLQHRLRLELELQLQLRQALSSAGLVALDSTRWRGRDI